MARGSGSAVAKVTAAILVIVVTVAVFHGEFPAAAAAATYVVGGNGGWTFNTVNWTDGKKFKAGDILVFNYDAAAHNVVAVSAAGYRSCTASSGSKQLRSGKDHVTLRRGTNYFICSVTGHCQAGMKIAVTAH